MLRWLLALLSFTVLQACENDSAILKIESNKIYLNPDRIFIDDEINLQINEELSVVILGLCKDKNGWYLLRGKNTINTLVDLANHLEKLYYENDSGIRKMGEKFYLDSDKLELSNDGILYETDNFIEVPIVSISKDREGWYYVDQYIDWDNLISLCDMDINASISVENNDGKSSVDIDGKAEFSHEFEGGSRIDSSLSTEVNIDNNGQVSEKVEASIGYHF